MSSVDNLQHVPTTFTWSQWGNHICIAGSFDPPNPVWTPIDMNKNADNISEVTLSLVPDKKYFYKFVIDGQWVLDPTIPSYPDESGNYNHVIEVKPPLPPPLPSEEEKMIEDQKDEVPLPPPLPSEEEKMTEDQKDEVPFPPHIPSEEEKMTEDQKDEVPLPPHIPSEEEKMTEDQKDDEEQKVENLESEIHHKEHYNENQVVNEDQELNQNVEEQVEVGIQKENQELNQNAEEQVEVGIQKEDQELNQNAEEQVEVDIQKEDQELNQNVDEVDIQKDQHQLEENQIQLQQGEKQILTEVQIEQNQHEESQVSINNDQKEHYQHFDDQITATADDQKEQHPHDDDQIVHQHEEVSKKTDVESDVTEKITESSTESSEAVQIDQSRDNSLVSEALEIETTSIMKETIIESDNEKLSAEHVANNESIEKTPDIVIDEETLKESQYTSSTSHDDSTNPVTFIEKEINISGEVTSEQTKEEMVSNNKDEGISSITTITQETPDSETSDVNVEGLSKLSNEVIIVQSVVKYDSINEFTEQSIIKDESINEFTEQSIIKDESINESTEQSIIKDESINEFTEQSVVKDESNEFTEQSVIKDDDSINKFTEQSVVFEDESKVTEFIEDKPPSIDEKHEQNVSPSSVKISDSTTNATETTMPSADVDYEETYEPELDPINENDDDDDDEDDDYEEDDYEEDDYNKDDDNEYSTYDDMFNHFNGETYPEGVSPESIKELILNHTWAKDESIDETIPSTWLESCEPTAYVWSENTQVEWSNKDTWALIEENTGTPKSEHVIEKIHTSNEVTESHEIPSTSLVEETATKQEEIPSSTNVNENLESTLVREMPAQSTIYNNESHMEDKTREIIVEEKAKEYDIMSGEKLVIKENINSTTEVKVIAEPSSVQYEKPESSVTADEKVSSMPTTVIAPANDQDTINADVLKAIEKLKLIEKQENSEESLTGVNISAGKISQRKISPISPNASSPGESTRNADMYTTHNITVATNASREIVSPTKESLSIKSKSKKKPPIEITSREVLQKDLKSVQQHDDLNKLDFNIVYLVTTVATTFTLGIISMLYKSVFGQKRNR